MTFRISHQDSRLKARLKMIYLAPAAFVCAPLHGAWAALCEAWTELGYAWTHEPFELPQEVSIAQMLRDLMPQHADATKETLQ